MAFTNSIPSLLELDPKILSLVGLEKIFPTTALNPFGQINITKYQDLLLSLILSVIFTVL